MRASADSQSPGPSARCRGDASPSHHRGARGDVRPALRRRRGLAAGRLLQQPVRGDLPPGLDEARGARPLRQRPPARARGGRARHRARALRRPVRDDRLRARSRAARSSRIASWRSLGAEDFKVPPGVRELLEGVRIVCTPMAAAGRYVGVVLSEREPGVPDDGRRRAPSAVDARQGDRDGFRRPRGDRLRRAEPPAAAADRPRARDPRGRRAAAVRDLAGALARGAARRRQPASLRGRGADGARRAAHRAARGRWGTPRARPPSRSPKSSSACARLYPALEIVLDGHAEEVPASLEALAQSVLVEAMRNAAQARQRDAASRSRCATTTARSCSRCATTAPPRATVPRRRRPHGGVGLRLATLEALQHDGVLEYGELEPGSWQVRLMVPTGQ